MKTYSKYVVDVSITCPHFFPYSFKKSQTSQACQAIHGRVGPKQRFLGDLNQFSSASHFLSIPQQKN